MPTTADMQSFLRRYHQASIHFYTLPNDEALQAKAIAPRWRYGAMIGTKMDPNLAMEVMAVIGHNLSR